MKKMFEDPKMNIQTVITEAITNGENDTEWVSGDWED